MLIICHCFRPRNSIDPDAKILRISESDIDNLASLQSRSWQAGVHCKTMILTCFWTVPIARAPFQSPNWTLKFSIWPPRTLKGTNEARTPDSETPEPRLQAIRESQKVDFRDMFFRPKKRLDLTEQTFRALNSFAPARPIGPVGFAGDTLHPHAEMLPRSLLPECFDCVGQPVRFCVTFH